MKRFGVVSVLVIGMAFCPAIAPAQQQNPGQAAADAVKAQILAHPDQYIAGLTRMAPPCGA